MVSGSANLADCACPQMANGSEAGKQPNPRQPPETSVLNRSQSWCLKPETDRIDSYPSARSWRGLAILDAESILYKQQIWVIYMAFLWSSKYPPFPILPCLRRVQSCPSLIRLYLQAKVITLTAIFKSAYPLNWVTVPCNNQCFWSSYSNSKSIVWILNLETASFYPTDWYRITKNTLRTSRKHLWPNASRFCRFHWRMVNVQLCLSHGFFRRTPILVRWWISLGVPRLCNAIPKDLSAWCIVHAPCEKFCAIQNGVQNKQPLGKNIVREFLND